MSRKHQIPNRGTKRWSVRYHGIKRKLRRATGILYEYIDDGIYWHERVTTSDRRRWRKWLDRKTLEQELQNFEEERELEEA